MTWERLIQQNASCFLAVVDALRAPLEVLATSCGPTKKEAEEMQREVWEEWGRQPPPLDEVIFS